MASKPPKKSALRRKMLERLAWLAPLTIAGMVLSVAVRAAQQVIAVWLRSLAPDAHDGGFGAMSDEAWRTSEILWRIGEKVDTAGYVVQLPTVVAFLAWLATAMRAANPAGKMPGLPTPRYAVGAYFIPFLNLVEPHRHMRRLLEVANERPKDEPPPVMAEAAYRATARAPIANAPAVRNQHLVTLWSGSWLLGLGIIVVGVIGQAAARLPMITARVLGFGCITVSFVFAALLVRAITRGLRARGARRRP